MQYCRRCLYPANHPLGISFDVNGICSGCRVHEEKDYLDWTEREIALRRLLDGYRARARGKHDCIVPVSGGRDSFFIVHLIRKVYGLNPLLVIYNRHYNTRAGIYNIARLRTALGCDSQTLTLRPSLVKRIMRATVSERGSFHWHALAGHTVFPVQVAVQTGISLIIWGAHQGLDQVGMFSHLDEVEMTRRYRREHDLMSLDAEEMVDRGGLSEKDLMPLFYPQDADLRRVGVRGIYLGNYIRWDSKVQHERMVRLYDYYMGPLTRTFDTYNDIDDMHYAGMHDVVKVNKWGYGKATDHACREIRFGRLTRAEGLDLAKRIENCPGQDAGSLAAFMEMSESHLMAEVDRHRDPAVWERAADGTWHRCAAPANVSSAADLPRMGDCRFMTNSPVDFEGPAHTQQLLTRGYLAERNGPYGRPYQASSI
jgi:N-acetyl sugar amidotransferase